MFNYYNIVGRKRPANDNIQNTTKLLCFSTGKIELKMVMTGINMEREVMVQYHTGTNALKNQAVTHITEFRLYKWINI
jgi:hypothetical protein